MKTKKTIEQTTKPQAKGKVKLKTLKLSKETIENLSDQNAEAVKGGAYTINCGSETCVKSVGCQT